MAKKKATKAPKKQSDSASAKIRAILDSGTTKPSEVIAEMKSKHSVDVKPGLVAAVKAKWKKASGKKRGKPARGSANGAMDVDTFLEVQKLVQKHGAKELVALIKKLS